MWYVLLFSGVRENIYINASDDKRALKLARSIELDFERKLLRVFTSAHNNPNIVLRDVFTDPSYTTPDPLDL